MTSLFNVGFTDALYMVLGRAMVLLTTLPIHEYAHGWMAHRLGDPTATQEGRLTLNPFAHLDPVGSVMILLFGVGWARPVPVWPGAFKNPKRGMALVALAGPVANLLMALLCLALYRVGMVGYALTPVGALSESVTGGLCQVLLQMCIVNIYLAVFNLLPIPPMDGSRLLGAVLPDSISWRFQNGNRILTAVVLGLLMFTNFLDRPLLWAADGVFGLLVDMTQFITTALAALFLH